MLETDDGIVLTEGPVIVQYVADKAPNSKLAPPAGSKERYQVQEWLNFITSELHKNFGPIFRPNTPDAYKQIARQNIEGRFKWVDQKLRRPPVSDGRSIHRAGRLSVRNDELGAARSTFRSIPTRT